jgi:hypothetical protein
MRHLHGGRDVILLDLSLEPGMVPSISGTVTTVAAMSRPAELNREFSQCLVNVMDGLYPSRVTMSAMDFRLLT